MTDSATPPDVAATTTTQDLLERLRAEAAFVLEPGFSPAPERASRYLAEAVHELRKRLDSITDPELLDEIDRVAGDLRSAVARHLYGELSWQAVWALEDETRVRLSRLTARAS